MKTIKTLTILMLVLLMTAACSDRADLDGGGNGDTTSNGIVMTLQLPNFSNDKICTRADGSVESLNSVYVVLYDENRKRVGDVQKITAAEFQKTSSNKIKVTIKAINKAKYIHVITNHEPTEDECADLTKCTLTGDPDTSSPVCWGYTTLDDLLGGRDNVTLVRQYAKASVSVAEAYKDKFIISECKIVGAAKNGSIAASANASVAPTLQTTNNWIADPSAATNDAAETYSASVSSSDASSNFQMAFFETMPCKAYLIIHAKYEVDEKTKTFVDGYYKVAFFNKNPSSNDDQMSLLRNHHYQLTVTSVNDKGCATEDEAKAGEAENRLLMQIVDDNSEIVDMIACKDYELGVCKNPYPKDKDLTAKLTIVTSYKDGAEEPKITIPSSADWITSITKEGEPTVIPEVTGHTGKRGKKYYYTIGLTRNYNSEARSVKINIVSGCLSRDLVFTQQGYDFRHDSERTVILRGLTGADISDYFSWLESTVRGIDSRSMQGVVRDDGLHFMVGNNTLSYFIPKIEGDIVTWDHSKINVVEESGKWKVTLNNNNSNDLWINREGLTIKIENALKHISITYPIYHVGIFSELSAAHQLGDVKKSGWFYYEVVKVKGTDGKTYRVLDRNLGASNNGFYSPATSRVVGNKEAIGGYFMITETKPSDTEKTNKTFTSNNAGSLETHGFKVPTNDQLSALLNMNENLKSVVQTQTSSGEKYYCTQMQTTGDSQLKYIYVPISGYYEGDNFKDEYHTKLWTQSPLADYQGFSSSSPEFGLWYMYMDIVNKQLTYSNVRIANGSGGSLGKRFVAMPVRLVAE